MSQATATQTKTYKIDENHSSARFWVRHMMIAKVHGEISDVSGTVVADANAPELAAIDATLQVASLTTSNDQRDAHLKSPDFLDVQNFPTIAFKSKRVSKTGDGEFDVLGDLTIHGVTREVTLAAEVTPEVKSAWGGYKIGVSATVTLDRESFGMTWNQALEAGGVIVGKDVHVQIDLELDRPED